MRKITKQQLNEIGEWISKNGRPLEVARWSYHFENGSSHEVLECLKAYQNEDGGFGHGLECDNWTPYSSPLTSSVACKIMYEVGFRKSNPIIKNCLNYFKNNYFNIETGTWATIVPENNDYPHAPWWSWIADGNNTWDFNPSIEIAGFMIYWSDIGSSEEKLANICFEKAQKHLFESEKMNFHEIWNYTHALILAKAVPEKINLPINLMEKKIIELVLSSVCLEPSKWSTAYVAQPIDFIDYINGDSNFIYSHFEDKIKENAEFLVESLQNNGLWDITWDWANQYPETFKIAKDYWKGVFAVEKLIKLKRLGFIEK
ncbi:hypothetical protein [Clostridium amazonitimonense]|uniref:hypothetical protein n=1 Tax=Clostridium amazonitimonense TaxID=1499689 RepID=UPI000509DB03|nr:hypothetical protein [Clostridium amazonitimonense]